MFRDQVVVVTGASSGIGEALARQFARRGAKLLLVARRADRLKALADELKSKELAPAAETMVADLTEPSAPSRVLDAAKSALGRIDVLVNNAGIGEYGPFASQDISAVEQMMNLNMNALVRLVRAALPDMIARHGGSILNVASTAAFQPTPYMAIYGATKVFVRNWSLALREELRDTGVTVTCVCPGPVKTEFFDRGGYEHRRTDFLAQGADPSYVARHAIEGLARGRALVIPGAVNKLGAFLTRIASLTLVTRASAKILGPKK